VIVAALAIHHDAAAQILAQVNPVTLSLTATPGKPLRRDIQISNLGTQPIAVHTRLSDWRLSEDGELSLSPAGSSASSLDGVIHFEPSEFALAPGQSRWIHMTMTLPASGAPTRWGVLLSEVRAAGAANADNEAAAGSELGTTIFLSRIPADEARATLGTLDLEPLGADSIRVSMRAHNHGLRHVGAAVRFVLHDSTGATMRTESIGAGVILPGESRRFAWICPMNLAMGTYRVVATFMDGGFVPLTSETRFHWPLVVPAAAVASAPAH
jgi:hypothetical protein